ncbi:DnaD domain-containing protein [Aureibacillus halotolerans]|uniref:Replicative DNA helicase loader DnaB n=1 Tax=Aureibacillus halotolerans TaxID=1508390 RepID=A0A4R6TS06_9BACI|nr:DnaD domain protein [Aureibacillus halotolerans]TDQ35247.1 replicative DNA helicase loader DnaB [Aureibacillus halotolerans]
MKFFNQRNAFYDRLEGNQLSSSAISLWYALMYTNDKAGWTDEFSVAASVLSLRAGVSVRTLSTARNELKQKGLIDFKSRKGNQAAIYTILDLCANIARNPSDNASNKRSDNASDSPSTLLQENREEEKRKEGEDVRENSFTFYEKNFGVLNPFISESIGKWCDDLTDEHVVEALEITLKNNKNSFRYAEAILREWQSLNLLTIEDVRTHESHKNQGRKGKARPKSNGNVAQFSDYSKYNLPF